MTNRVEHAVRDFLDSFAALEQAAAKLPFRLPGWNDETNEVKLDEEPLSEKEIDTIDEVQGIVDGMWSKVRELEIAYDLAKPMAA